MEEFYVQIRHAHIGAVILSGLLFTLRAGAFNIMDATWPKQLPARLAAWTIDTALLTAALILMTIVQQYPFVDAWLTVKVLLLVVYIALGAMAFSTRRSRAQRIGFYAAALAVFLFIVTVARAHHPLGLLSGV